MTNRLCLSSLKVNLHSSDQKNLTTDFNSLARNSHLLNQSQLAVSDSIPGFLSQLSVNTNKAKKIPVKLLQSIWSKDAQEDAFPQHSRGEKHSPHQSSPMSMPHPASSSMHRIWSEQYHVIWLSSTIIYNHTHHHISSYWQIQVNCLLGQAADK